jgi:hypothetical protein
MRPGGGDRPVTSLRPRGRGICFCGHAHPAYPAVVDGPFAPEQALPGGILTDADLLTAFAGRQIPEPSRAWHLPEETKATPETRVSEPLR